MKIVRLIALSLSVVVISLCVATFSVNLASADHCRGKHKNEPGCGAEPPGVSYDIHYNFATATSDTSIQAPIVCGTELCEFEADVSFDFHLPSTFLSLFSSSDANNCFGTGHSGDPGHVQAHSIFFRSGHGKTDWHTHVVVAARTTADQPVDYTFHFGGACPGSVCPRLPNSSGWMETFMGELQYVDLPSRGRGKRAPGCTCAWEECDVIDDSMDITLTEN